MALRTGHGGGAGQPRIEVLPPDELPPASPTTSTRPDRGPDGRFLPGNKPKKGLVRPSIQGGLHLDRSCAEYRAFLRWGRRYAAQRRRELAELHGGSLSVGVEALIESAAMVLASSRYLHFRGAESGSAETLRQASMLSIDARQHELAAWELASREAGERPKQNPVAAWLEEPEPKQLKE